MRKLAEIKRIEEIKSIEGADAICAYRVDGWWVVGKINEFKVGDMACYFQIDSWIPTELASFLSKGKVPKVYNGIKGERLKTIRLKGQLSQGLLLPLEPTCSKIESELFEGLDVTEFLGIQKWEAPEPVCLMARGNFPTEVPKTDQTRIQSLVKEFVQWKHVGVKFNVTEKLEGSSFTATILPNGEFHVCSRNLPQKDVEESTWWKVAKRYNLEQQMRDNGLSGFAIQAEIIGNSMNGNIYKMSGHDIRVFHIYDIMNNRYLTLDERLEICSKLGLTHVPIIQRDFSLDFYSVPDILRMADGQSAIGSTLREGLVFESLDAKISWEAVSNEYLLKQK